MVSWRNWKASLSSKQRVWVRIPVRLQNNIRGRAKNAGNPTVYGEPNP